MSSGQGRVDVEVESKRPDEAPPERRIRTRAQGAARTTGTTSSQPPCVCARSAGTTSRFVPASGSSSSRIRGPSSRRTPSFARPTRSRSSTSVRTRSASPKRRWRPASGTRSSAGAASDRGRGVPSRGHGLRLHGRLDGERRRGEVRARLRERGRRRSTARLRVGVRRRADAGGDPRADAAPEDGRAPSRSCTNRAARSSPCSRIRRRVACSPATRASATSFSPSRVR